MDRDYITLSKNFALKGAIGSYFISNFRNGECYELTEDQFDFLTLCDGERRLRDILSDYDLQDHKKILDLLKKLKKIEAIVNKPSKRCIQTMPPAAPPHLQMVHFDITGLCNLSCKHCYQERYSRSRANELSTEEVMDVIDEIYRLNTVKLVVSGGEPFMRKDIFVILNFIVSR